MTRIAKFARIDFMRIRNYKWIVLFPILAIVIFLAQSDTSPLYLLSYCIFAGIIFSTIPCSVESPSEAGFLQMLPARPGEQQKGHFLFAFLFTLLSYLSGFACVLICHLIRPNFQIFMANGINIRNTYLMILSTALLFVGIQTFVLSILRFKSAQAMALLRMVPAFIFLFGISGIFDTDPEVIESSLRTLHQLNGGIILGISLVIYIILAQAAAIIISKKQ